MILYTLFIFSNSLQNGTDSGRMSGNITRIILHVLESLHIDVTFEGLHHFIRKAAHFSEYFVQGLLVSFAQRKSPFVKNDVLCIGFWMVMTPLCDELIQHYTADRFGAFSDVFLDMCGFACAALLFYILFRKKKR